MLVARRTRDVEPRQPCALRRLCHQHGDAVMTMEGWGMFGRRPQAAA
jgi:hypothetical protein